MFLQVETWKSEVHIWLGVTNEGAGAAPSPPVICDWISHQKSINHETVRDVMFKVFAVVTHTLKCG